MSPTIDTDAFRRGKAYSIAEGARLVQTGPQNVRRWMYGDDAWGRHMHPVREAKGRLKDAPALSFLDLIELAVANDFRREREGKASVPLRRIRAAHRFLREQLDMEYPFASTELRQSGAHILHDFAEKELGPGALVVWLRGQWALPADVEEELDRVDYEGGLAARWHLISRGVLIVVNPRVAVGSPTIEGTGVRLLTIRDRLRAGDSVDYLAQDYDIPAATIEQVLPFVERVLPTAA